MKLQQNTVFDSREAAELDKFNEIYLNNKQPRNKSTEIDFKKCFKM